MITSISFDSLLDRFFFLSSLSSSGYQTELQQRNPNYQKALSKVKCQ
ncbi:hypothetical protein NCMFCNCE_00485 [Mannheimia haemolytica]|nr:hypothetical protein COI_0194 [Mannheimia haemolytica serotype A2 str. OVINE]SQE31188.1 Uncharacterised protein [Mannheimia haemolytica]